MRKCPLQGKEKRDIIMKNGGHKMRDFPIFTTDFGVSSLILKEIPYKKAAYIRIRDVQEAFLGEHLEECVKFCRMVGADRIFAAGSEKLNAFPVYTSVLEMRGDAWVDREKLRCLFPVTEQTVSRWRSIANERLAGVDNSATLESRDEKEIVASGGAYFIHNDGELLGIGWVKDTELLLVAAVKPGAGEQVMHTLMSLVEGAPIRLEVASTNAKAIHLYEKLGFLKTAEVTVWYEVT